MVQKKKGKKVNEEEARGGERVKRDMVRRSRERWSLKRGYLTGFMNFPLPLPPQEEMH